MLTIDMLKNILVLDIETVAAKPDFNELNERFQWLWEKKAGLLKNEEGKTAVSLYNERAAIYAEFGKVICIGLGVFYQNKQREWCIKTKVLKNASEKELLLEFKELLDKRYNTARSRLCAHNGKEFDFPYLCRRMLINGVPLPLVLDTSGRKPWEVNHLDTMEMWKFGDKKNYTSLELLAAVFEIPTSKSDIDGSMVNETYYRLAGVNRIAAYCRRDIVVTCQLFLKLSGFPPIEEDNITSADED